MLCIYCMGEHKAQLTIGFAPFREHGVGLFTCSPHDPLEAAKDAECERRREMPAVDGTINDDGDDGGVVYCCTAHTKASRTEIEREIAHIQAHRIHIGCWCLWANNLEGLYVTEDVSLSLSLFLITSDIIFMLHSTQSTTM